MLYQAIHFAVTIIIALALIFLALLFLFVILKLSALIICYIVNFYAPYDDPIQAAKNKKEKDFVIGGCWWAVCIFVVLLVLIMAVGGIISIFQ